MTLENTFYVMGIVFMTLSIGILIAIAYLVFYIKKKVDEMYLFAESKVDAITSKVDAITNAVPTRIALGVGTAVAEKATETVKKMFSKKKSTD